MLLKGISRSFSSSMIVCPKSNITAFSISTFYRSTDSVFPDRFSGHPVHGQHPRAVLQQWPFRNCEDGLLPNALAQRHLGAERLKSHWTTDWLPQTAILA